MKKVREFPLEDLRPTRKFIEEGPSNSILEVFPEELLHVFIRALPSPGDVLQLSVVCRYLYCLAQNSSTWKLLVERTWGISEFAKVNKGFDWKLYYREKLAFQTPLDWNFIDCDPHPPPRQSHGAARVGNKMIILGGHQVVGESFQRQDDIWVFDTTTNKFEQIVPAETQMPSMSRHRVLTIGNKVYAFGGILQNKTKLNAVFSLDIDTLSWKELQVTGQPPDPRCDPVVVSYGKNMIVFGGSVQDLVFPSDVHVFDTETNTWSQPETYGSVPPSRIGATGVVIGDLMYIYGGGDYDKERRMYKTLFTELWTLNLQTYSWSQVRACGDIPKIMDFLNAFVVGNHLVIEGGWYSEPYAFDTISRRWQQLTNKQQKKVNNNDSSATLIGDSVYYFGGYHNTYKHHLFKLDISHLSFLLPTVE